MLIDSYGRNVDYLRVSVTEQCNFRCQYCMPDTPLDSIKKESLVPLDDLFLFVKVSIDNGIRKIRITGGEPLIRDDIDKFIDMIKSYKDGIDIALTTNAYYLKNYAQRLKSAGLKRINVSLDSLNRATQQLIAKKDVLPNILEGIEEAKRVGLGIKINMVPLKNINEDEMFDILEYSRELGATIRFIEFMENDNAKDGVVGLRSEEMLEKLSQKYNFKELEKDFFGPANLYELEDGYMFGIIEPHNDNFCSSCNRVRLSADGFLIPCLYFEDAIDLKNAMKSKDEAEISNLLHKVVSIKPEKNKWGSSEISSRAFYKTGG